MAEPQMKITMPNMDHLLAKLVSIEQLKGLSSYIRAAAFYVKGKLMQYPAVSRRPQPFKTAKQRRAFFAMLKDGTIEVPYYRGDNPKSESLATSWTLRKEFGGLRYTVGTNVSYARLVMDRDEQAMYHKVTGWQTVQDIAEDPEVTGEVLRLIGKGIEVALGG